MRRAAKRRVSNVQTVPAPVGGIDDTSSIANMDPNFAIDILNYFPTSADLKVRGGYREHVTGMASVGKTLMSYVSAGSSGSKLFCATDDGIYDVTSSGSSPTMVKAITNGNVQWTQFSNISGNWLIGCNGTDPAFFYNGTSWGDFVADATPTLPGEIDGFAPEDLVDVCVYQNRLWFAIKDSLSAAYLPLSAVAGTLTEFPLGGILSKGGYLSSIFTWTVDAGIDLNDILVFQSSSGEITGYSGDDPASNFTLEARYYVGRPLGRKTNVELNGDVMMLCEYGIIPISRVVGGQYRQGVSEGATSDRVSRALNTLVNSRGVNIGWEIVSSPIHQSLILQLPGTSGIATQQYVMNTVTGAWTRYDLPATSFLQFEDRLYFTDETTRVMVYGTTTVDDVMLDGTGGDNIIAGFQQAYNYFGAPTSNKHYKMIRPIFESVASPAMSIGIGVDFSTDSLNSLNGPGALVVAVGSSWDSAVWDVGTWATPPVAHQRWNGLSGVGYCASLIIKTETSIETSFVAANWVYELGNSL